MNNYHMITDATAYAALRLDLITMGEGEETGVYVDTAREGNPSIGYGYNLE
jgi:hypothetical protein